MNSLSAVINPVTYTTKRSLTTNIEQWCTETDMKPLTMKQTFRSEQNALCVWWLYARYLGKVKGWKYMAMSRPSIHEHVQLFIVKNSVSLLTISDLRRYFILAINAIANHQRKGIQFLLQLIYYLV